VLENKIIIKIQIKKREKRILLNSHPIQTFLVTKYNQTLRIPKINQGFGIQLIIIFLAKKGKKILILWLSRLLWSLLQ